MSVKLKRRYLQIVIFLTGLCIQWTDSGTGDPYSSQPRLIIQNGHLVFQTAQNHNISFVSAHGGYIRINNDDIVRVVEEAKTTTTNIQQFGLSNLETLNQRVNRLQAQFDEISNFANRLNELETNYTRTASRVNDLQRTLSSLNRRSVRQRLQALENSVNELDTALQENNCLSNPCQHGAACIDAYKDYICQCTPGWQGKSCSDDINECQDFVGTNLGCKNGATCINTVGSYSCNCPPNWYGAHCNEQHDDCNSASHQELCVHGTCINENSGGRQGQPNYRCICDEGWTTGPGSPACVVDVDECTGHHYSCSRNPPVSCINLPGTFHCGPCPSGYTGNGHVCNDINECASNNGGCSIVPMVECINTVGSRICGSCPTGYQGDGIRCNYVDVCINNNGGCHPQATCVMSGVSSALRECRCPSGFSGNGIGPNGCSPSAGTACETNPCLHGSCQVVGNSYRCICSAGYTGVNCENTLSACYSNPCRNGGTCTAVANGFTCACASNWRGTTCEDVVESCGGYFTEDTGIIKYPSDETSQYSHRVSCNWVIATSNLAKVLNLTFTSFDIEDNHGCTFDFLQINDGPYVTSSIIGRFCGNTPPGGGSIVTTHNSVYLWFNSDESVAADGFQLTWTTVDPVCGGNLMGMDQGTIRSPGYPNNYPHSRDCYWRVEVPIEKRIKFIFSDFNIEHHVNCSYDFLQIYDGLSENDPVLRTYCGRETTLPGVTTSGPSSLVHFHTDESESASGFLIAYISEARVHGCGGLLTNANGQFSSPQFPNAYVDNLRCEWLVRLHPRERIQLNFTTFDVESHRACGYDYVEVIDGEHEGAPVIGRYCNSIRPPVISSSSNIMRIIFSTDSSVVNGGFVAKYTTACGGTFTGLSGELHSPNYPDRYPFSKTCYYRIVVPPGNIVKVEFLFFDVESSDGFDDCVYDYLEIREVSETGSLIGKYCGNNLPEVLWSSYNHLWLKFVSDGSIQNRGFLLNYASEEIGCGGVLTDRTGIISTPNYLTEEGFLTCNWLLKAEAGFVVKLSFIHVNLRTSDRCTHEYIKVFDTNGQEIKTFCGQEVPPILRSSDNEMIVTFRTMHQNLPEGFSASYIFVDSSQDCGGDFYTQSGEVKSPGYPQYYPHQRECTWVLHTDGNKQIAITVLAFNLERHSSCRYDYLEIRNGGYSTSPLVGKFCGTNGPANFTSHGHTLWLHFSSDRSQSAPGFRIIYQSTVEGGCGGVVTSPEGAIISPGFPEPYHHNAECNWLIQVALGSIIKFSLRDVDIESHTTCDYDFLQVYDGDSERARSIIKVCGQRQYSEQFVSTGNKLFIKFRTDFSANGRGFHLLYEIDCNNVLKGHRGVIESPNFPSPYFHLLNCTWKIVAPIGNNVSIAFSHLVMEFSEDCSYDSLEIAETSSIGNTERQILKYCGGNEEIEPLLTSQNIAIVRFLTDHSVSYDGFRLEWQVRGCGGELKRDSGIIQSPNYPNSYPLTVECLWYVTVSPGKKIEFTIERIQLETSHECVYDYVKVYGGEDETSPQIGAYCNPFDRSQTITTHGNHLTVHFYSDYSYAGMGFYSIYRSVEGGCGGRYTATSGTLTSPNYNGNFDPDDDCTFTIEVDNNHLIQLRVEDFDISPASVNCSNSYLAIYDGASEEDGLLLRHCGSSIPERAIYRSTSNTVFLRMKADGAHSSRGFKITYGTVCGARINAEEGGEIMSPNYPHAMQTIGECYWILYLTDLGEKITIVVTDLSTTEMYNVNCTYQYVKIRSGMDSTSPLLHQFCGNLLPPPIMSPGNALHISFLGNRFRATYGTSRNTCGGTMLGEHGTFTSPDYPNSYPINAECVWNISAAAGNKIQLSFSIFSIEESDYCNSDYVEIREDSDSGYLIGKYCGNNVPSNLTRISGRIWMKFRSDERGTGVGFIASYSLVHGVELNGTEGFIESPSYPRYTHREEEFTWIITVPPSMFVKITFLQIDLEEATYGSCSSYVLIIDGAGQYGLELQRYCTRTIPEPVVTTNNKATIKFHNRHIPGRWQLMWRAVSSTGNPISPHLPQNENSCWENLNVNETNTTIQSQGYPHSYENNQNCTWIINAGEHRHVKLDILDLNIEGWRPTCYYDRLLVYDLDYQVSSWNMVAKICGRVTLPTSFSSATNVMKLSFITDGYYSLSGFKAVARSECGGTFFSSQGVLNTSDASPSYGRPPCEWVIVVRPGRTIRLNFEEFNIPDDSSCSHQYLLIRNGGGATSPFLGDGKFCNNNRPHTFESLSHEVFIQLTSQYSYHSNQPTPIFKIRYEEVSVGCGGQFHLSNSNPSLIITSPNHPNPPPHDTECQWVLMGPPNSRLRIDFNERLDIESGCHDDNSTEFLEIRDGGTVNSDVIRKMCGQYQPSSVFSTGNIISIRYVTSAQKPRSGFNATVLIATCGGRVTVYNTSLSSPNYPLNYENNMECEWIITTWQFYIIKVYFEDIAIVDDGACNNDYVYLSEGNSLGPYLTKQCGMTNISEVFQSESHTIYLKFKTNATGTGRGFMIRFIAERPDCGGELRSPSGVIESPGFPYSTSLRRSCNWKIFVEEGRIITFTFSNFNLRQDPVNNTCINKLLIWNGTDEIWNVHEKMWYCGNSIPAPVDSIDNTASMFYYSFGNLGGEGFRLTYTSDKAAVCGGKLSYANGTFSSPGFENGTTSNFFHCIWRLRNEGEVSVTLVIQFDILDLPSNSTQNCILDYLVIQEGDIAVLEPSSRRICGNFTRQNLLVSTPTNALLVALIKNSSEPFRGFNASYSTQECGGQIEIGIEGKSPNFPYNYPQNTVCHWRIDAEVGIQIKLTFIEFELESDCSKDYIEIRSGQRYDSPVHGTYCGSNLPGEITSHSNHLTILFRSDSTGSAKGFHFTTNSVHRGCGGIIKASESFSSPVMEGSSLYPNNAECIWLLESDIDYHHNITFVNRYDIEMEQNCNNDYLQVDEYENNTWKFINKYCGSSRPAPIISSSNHVRVMFRSNERVQADGFTISHSIACGRTFLMEDTGIISSPGFPGNYPDNLNCEYLIQNSPSAHITLQFDSRFFIENHPACDYDSLIVYGGNSTSSQKIGNFCGSAVPDPVSSKGAMLLVFKTDWVVTKIGFMATFRVSKCGGQLTDPEGTFGTQNIVRDNISSVNCTWVITVEPNRVIELKFLSFDLRGMQCYRGYVKIYDSDHIRYSSLKARYCGSDNPQPLQSRGQNLTIYFWTARSSRFIGFEAAYRTTYGPDQGCGGLFSNESGEISSLDINGDGKYESKLDCIWNIHQPRKLVHITFQLMDIETGPSNNGSCPYDYLEIRDGITLHDPIIGRFCGTQLPKDIISTAGRVMLHFHTDSLNERRGFRLSYSGEEPTCGGSLYVTDVPQTLTSINYPNPYEPNLHCQWKFYLNHSVHAYDPIELTFHDMDIPCGGDRIEIREDGMDHRTLQFCGQHIIHHFTVIYSVKLNFVTDMEGAGRGFSLSYMTGGCNRSYTHDNAVIYSPRYPYNYFTNTDCGFSIHTEEGRTIAVYFNFFRVPYGSDPSCMNSGMEIHEGIDASGPVIGRFCNNVPNPIFSRSNAIFARWKPYDSVVYSISYTTTDQGRGCGGNLTSVNGTFTSPLYPFPCNITTQCRWYITVPGEHTLTLEFSVFELNSTRGCETNYVEIYESHDELDSNRVGRYCGTDRPASHSSRGNTVIVKLVTSTNNNAPGFKAAFYTNSLGGSLNSMSNLERNLSYDYD